jgi:competence protein ComEC
MQNFNSKLKIKLTFGVIVSAVLVIFSLLTSLPNGKLLMVFCDVGQGDAIYIRTPKGADILVDGGPDGRVLGCLSKHMPFWDREIELAFLTHPQADHMNGMLAVLQRYSVKSFGVGVEGNSDEGYKKLRELLEKNNVQVFNPYRGQKISFDDGVAFDVLWPTNDWVSMQVGQVAVMGAETGVDLNIFSTVLMMNYKDFEAILMGDADSKIQGEILSNNSFGEVEVLKVPHHGSKTALDQKFLEAIRPKTAVISVGKNSFGHPSAEIIERLRKVGANIKRTDEGEVVVKR